MKMKPYPVYYSALLGSIILFALSPVIIKLLVTMGGAFGLQHPDSVSFCNVLFVGNLCAAIVIGVLFNGFKLFKEVFRLPLKQKFLLLLAMIISALSPSLVFIGLELSSVVNLVIISRLNVIFYLIVAFFVFRSRVTKEETIGYVVIVVSVFSMLFINNHGFYLKAGDIVFLFAGLILAPIDVISAKVLLSMSDKSYAFFRNLGSAIIFLVIVLLFFKPGHFATAFTGELWIIMLVYAGLTIVVAQLLLYFSLKKMSASTIGNTHLFDPIYTLLGAFLLLGEKPSISQFIIIVIIAMSVAVPKFLLRRKSKKAMTEAMKMPGNGLSGTT